VQRLLTTLLVFAGLIGFAPAAPVPTHLFPKNPLYISVQKGTRWVYEGTSPGELVVSSSEWDEKSGTTTVTITSPRQDGSHAPNQKLAVSGRGILWLENTAGPFDSPFWLLKVPVRQAEEWAFTTSGSGIANTIGTMKVVRVEDIEVPAGKFTTVRVKEEVQSLVNGKPAGGYSQTRWYAPGVGLVKWQCGDAGTVLKSFTPGK
jgi:hypothetical protein